MPRTIAYSFCFQLLSSAVRAYMPVHVFVYQFLCITGVFANISIIVVLLRPAMRKNPFNVFLTSIAVCDMTLMAFYFIYKRVEVCHPTYFSYFWIVFTYLYAILSVFVHSVSLWLTVNMAILRYLVLKRSSNSQSALPNVNSFSAAFVAIALGILISFIGSAPNMLRYEVSACTMCTIRLPQQSPLQRIQ
ncbi:unnamed protein product [Anisakis simplex]|uniref:G_PROTEIN_RECEP_F1_2 domain-containing protein n=1 Tax=Anisakis simplex TaxID=6269 RepID=A0A0M3K9V5_ANISI|nr:unnamed protein product [Anisakis simplex]